MFQYDAELVSEILNVARNRKEVYIVKEMNKYDKFDEYVGLFNKVIGYVNYTLNIYEKSEERGNSHMKLNSSQENSFAI